MGALRTFVTGIAPEHLPAFLVGLLVAVGLPFLRPADRPPFVADRWAVTLLGVAAAVHVALPLGHHHGSYLLQAGFLLDGLAYALLAYFAYLGRGWRVGTALVVPATLVGYLVVVVRGGEDPDQLGIAIALMEIAAAGIALRGLPGWRIVGNIATATLVGVFGAIVWIGSFAAHTAADASSGAPAVASGHDHEHLGRAQAGVIMRPWTGPANPTAAQAKAAADLWTTTRRAMARYATVDDALTAGYAWPLGKHSGPDVHMENKAYRADGRQLDPDRPEMLVFSVANGRSVLLGVVFVMERAGEPGPDPGGPLTRWHAHNLCVSLYPPGIGIVTPYGGCPALSLSGTIPEMMHVWVAPNPAGPFSDSVDPAWSRAYLAEHGAAARNAES
ncbi:hypothetical protein [Hamadaea tsunoensis]|uniref:hypothetical protein n=1 Tax=Hamadaea tsunoensis TaxID=53368 RepID=UPI0004157B44|nr:hypothetical protein [Hamadaea tsunoensis]